MSLRIERFELRAFGPFTGTVLELQGAPRGAFHIICGPNEVGKSTAQRAVGDFLFGIPPRSTDNQLHDYVDMRLGAVVADSLGNRSELVRRKGARSTLLGSDGHPIDEDCLERMLGGLTRDAFESMFSITHESLVVGGNALLAAGGEVGESLFSASLGVSGLHKLRQQLDTEASALFRPRATSSLILQARSRLDAADAQLRETTLRASAFVDNEHQLKVARAARHEVAEQLRAARESQNARRRLRSAIPLLLEREQLIVDLAELGEGPALPGDCTERRVRATERNANGRAALEETTSRVASLRERISALNGDDRLVDRELAIRDLHGRVASVREGAADLERQTGKLHIATELAKRALDEVRPDVDLAEAQVLILSGRQRARIDAALDRHAQLVAVRDQAELGVSEAAELLRELQASAEQLSQPPDTSALEMAVSEARSAGNIEQRLREEEEEERVADEQLAAALRELEPAAELDALKDKRPPTEAAINRFAGEYNELAERRRTLVDRRHRLDADSGQLDEERERLVLNVAVPTVEELTVTRSERDADWRQLRRRLEGDQQASVSPDGFEHRVYQADAVADRLREHADAVARAADLTLRDRRLQADDADLERQLDDLEQDQLTCERRWTETWIAIEIEPRTPLEMVEWLRQRYIVLERALAAERRRRVVSSLRQAQEAHSRALRAELTALGSQLAPDVTLSRLLAAADAAIATAHAARTEQARLAADVQATEVTARRQYEKADACRRELAGWDAEWKALASESGWPADVDAVSARHVMAAVEELARQLRDMSQFRTRVSGIEDRIRTFGSDAAKLVAEVSPDLASWPAPDAVAELARLLDKAVQRRNRREALQGELEIAQEELETAECTVEQAERDLAALVAAAGVETAGQLPAVEQRAARLRLLATRLPELESQIAEAARAALPDLIERATGVDLETLDVEIEATENKIAELEEQLAQLDVRLGELGSERQVMERTGGASEAAQLVEQRLAELRELVERYLRVQVSAWALAEAIEEYRREHKDPLLRRADELFPHLTCGSFKALEVGFDESDEPVLVGVRQSGERIPVERMSTGTREQLYLALRLASLERHVAMHGPMPVILDDVVLHSDPKRKSAILGALAELGRVTQVIAFSHDPQVVALVQGAVDPELVTVHELGGREITNALHPVIGAADVRPIRRPQAA